MDTAVWNGVVVEWKHEWGMLAMLAIYPAQYQVNSCTGRWGWGFVHIAQCGGLDYHLNSCMMGGDNASCDSS